MGASQGAATLQHSGACPMSVRCLDGAPTCAACIVRAGGVLPLLGEALSPREIRFELRAKNAEKLLRLELERTKALETLVDDLQLALVFSRLGAT